MSKLLWHGMRRQENGNPFRAAKPYPLICICVYRDMYMPLRVKDTTMICGTYILRDLLYCLT